MGKQLRALGAAAFAPSTRANSPRGAKRADSAVLRIQAIARGGQARTESRERSRGRAPRTVAAHCGRGAPGAPGVVGAPGGGARALAGGACGHYGQSPGYPSYAQQQGYAQHLSPSVGASYGGYGGHGAHAHGAHAHGCGGAAAAAVAWPSGGGYPVY